MSSYKPDRKIYENHPRPIGGCGCGGGRTSAPVPLTPEQRARLEDVSSFPSVYQAESRNFSDPRKTNDKKDSKKSEDKKEVKSNPETPNNIAPIKFSNGNDYNRMNQPNFKTNTPMTARAGCGCGGR